MEITERRKDDHIRLAMSKDVEFKTVRTGFEEVRLMYRSLPEGDYSSVSTETVFAGERVGGPVIISGMTGGTSTARKINKRLAELSREYRLPIGVGSLRALLENPNRLSTYSVVREITDMPIIGNIGVVQLKTYPPDDLLSVLDQIGGSVLAVHVNPEQEVIQPEGDTDFSGCLSAISDLVRAAGKIPVMVKGVGHGIDPITAKRLLDVGVRYLDVAGAGGTSWTRIEYLRGRANVPGFEEVGLPTVISLVLAHRVGWGGRDRYLIGSGGVRSGVDVGKVLLLGGDYAGIARPILTGEVNLGQILFQLKTLMFLMGSPDIETFKKVGDKGYVLTGWVKDWLDSWRESNE